MKYDLVFVLLWHDANLPLVLSQTFDQAQVQAELPGDDKPDSVSVWILTPLRYLITGQGLETIRKLRSRCPGLIIRLVPEINRLKNFPARYFLKYLRNKLKSNVILHFRGESTFHHFRRQYRKNNYDQFVIDVRGYWPAELLYARGIEDINAIPDEMQDQYLKAINALKNAIELADGVITVSKNLSVLLQDVFPLLGKVNIVPCSVRSIADHSQRGAIRYKLGVLEDEKLLVYSGGYARYQHLEDLTIPFIKLLISLNSKIKVLILSHTVDQIKPIVERIMGSTEKFIFLNVPQNEVAGYLVACDLGFLLRRKSLVNRVAQPVKVGEYLAAGVPVCVQGEVGGVTEKLISYNAGLSVDLVDQGEEVWLKHSYRILNFLKSDNTKQAQLLAQDYFVWDRNVLKQRQYYNSILKSK